MLKVLLKYGSYIFICLACDWLFELVKQKHPKWLPNSRLPSLLPLITDNMAHGIIAFHAWLLLCNFEWSLQCLCMAFACFISACVLDVDHFLAAKSLHLKDALSLDSRPPFHCSTILAFHFLIFAMLLATKATISKITLEVLLCSFIAIATHHLRDGQRRGLWLWPVGSTPPIKWKLLYLALMVSTVQVCIYMKKNVKTLSDYNSLVEIEAV